MKKVKRVRIKFKNVFLSLLGIGSIIFTIYLLLNKEINNIYISGNNILEEQEILELIDFDKYLKYYEINSNKIEKRLKTSLLINKANVKKSFFALEIDILEYKPLWIQENDNSIMLSSGETVNLDKKLLGIPSMTNEIENEYKNKFIEKLCLVDSDVFNKISEITYTPSDIDKERFLLYMNDKNYVYINISRMEYLNKYDELLPELDNKKGILYLDSGNHFEIKK